MGLLTNLQRAAVPNIPSLRQLVRWFDEVSGILDVNPTIVAMANVDAGGTFNKNYGFASPILHPNPGQYALNLDVTTYDINTLIPFANVTNVGTPGGAINIYPTMTLGSQVFLNIWQIAVTTAARSAVDAEFMVVILQFPTP